MKKRNVLIKEAYLSGRTYKNMNACVNGAFVDIRNCMPEMIICTDYPKQLKKILEKKFFLNHMDVNRFIIGATRNFSKRFQSIEVTIIKGSMADSYQNFMYTPTDGTFYNLLKAEHVTFRRGVEKSMADYNNRDLSKIYNVKLTRNAKRVPSKKNYIKSSEQDFLRALCYLGKYEKTNMLTENREFGNNIISDKFNEYKEAILFVSSVIFGGELNNALLGQIKKEECCK